MNQQKASTIFGYNNLNQNKMEKEPKQETLEEAAANLADPNLCKTDNWIAGAKWQAERMYSEEEVKSFLDRYRSQFRMDKNVDIKQSDFIQWFEQFKKK